MNYLVGAKVEMLSITNSESAIDIANIIDIIKKFAGGSLMSQKRNLGELEFNAYHPIYRRSDGSTWMKVNSNDQFPANQKDGKWLVAGAPERINGAEEVEVLHFADEKVA